MRLRLQTWFAMPLALIVFSIAASPPTPKNVNLDDRDLSINPGDDFYRYANGGWLKANTIPAGKSKYDTGTILADRTSQQVRELIQNAAYAHTSSVGVVQKVGDYYASFLNEANIEAKGLSPLANEMAKIAAIKDTSSLSAYLGTTLNSEVDGLTANSDHIFGIWVNQGFDDSDHNLPTSGRVAWECRRETSISTRLPRWLNCAVNIRPTFRSYSR